MTKEMVDTGKVTYVFVFELQRIHTNALQIVLPPIILCITGYSTINSIEEMKNALYYRGDVAVGYLAAATPGDDLSGNGVVFPESDIDLHEQADLGEGISFSSPAGQTTQLPSQDGALVESHM